MTSGWIMVVDYVGMLLHISASGRIGDLTIDSSTCREIATYLLPALNRQFELDEFVVPEETDKTVLLQAVVQITHASWIAKVRETHIHQHQLGREIANKHAPGAMLYTVLQILDRLKYLGVHRKLLICFSETDKSTFAKDFFPVAASRLETLNGPIMLPRETEQLTFERGSSFYRDIFEVLSKMPHLNRIKLLNFDAGWNLGLLKANALRTVILGRKGSTVGSLKTLESINTLETLIINDSIDANLDDVPANLNLLRLEVYSTRVRNWLQVRQFCRLRELLLRGPRIKAENLEVLGSMHKLSELHLPGTALRGYTGIGSPKLDLVRLDESQCVGNPAFAELPPTLSLSVAASRGIVNLSRASGASIQRLNLSRLGEIASFAPLLEINGLEQLSIHGTSARDNSLDQLFRIETLRMLTVDSRQFDRLKRSAAMWSGTLNIIG